MAEQEQNQNPAQTQSQPQQAPKQRHFSKPWVQTLSGIFIVILILVGFLYWRSRSAYVGIDTSEISAPVIAIGPQASGILSDLYVRAGDMVKPGDVVAHVGSEVLTAKVAGLVISVNNMPGQVFAPGSAVVSMIQPEELRIVGKIDEDKGLSQIQVGDTAAFTVDAFGSQEFTGVVDEISPTSEESGVVFNISDKREEKQFLVKVKYDIAAHPEFKNGMSAKLRIYAK